MSAATRRRVLAPLAALAFIGAVTMANRLLVRAGPPADAALILSASLAVAIVGAIAAEWPRSRGWLVASAAVAATASLIATLAHTPREAPQDAFWILAESLALLTLLVLVARWVPKRSAVGAGGLTAVAVMATMWRITVPTSPPDVPALIGALLNWSVGVALAAGLGIYLRALDTRRSRSVVEARRAQRLELARDLHDFVAHDVTGMVVQAQAAHVVADKDPGEALAALGRIEEAGLRALGSLDHTVRMLGHLAAPGGARNPAVDEESQRAFSTRRFALEDVLALVGRFAATDVRPIRLHVDTTAEPRIPAEVVSIAYRVILEALTNVRRHAPASACVDVSLVPGECATGPALAVRVTNDAAVVGQPALSTPARVDGSRGGRGLEQLAEYVDEIAGTFVTGHVDGTGSRSWHVTAVLPLQRTARS
jgi:signal transduction histidine kinase